MDWVIDTDVLVRADRYDENHDHWVRVSGLLSAIDRLSHTLVVDNEDKIKNEYDRNLNNSGWVRRYIQRFTFRGQVRYVSGSLYNRIYNRLRALRFDADDDVFIAVATRTTTHRLVAEESDYSTSVVDYLASEGVRVINCETAVTEANE